MSPTITATELDETRQLGRGKVRDIYEFEDKLLLVATDRLSAFDVVFEQGIPRKGEVLTQLAAFWFERTRHIIPNHLITADFNALPETLKRFEFLRGRASLCRRAEVIPIECVARQFLEGSAWKEYQASGEVAGIALPKGLARRGRLDSPIFTPATKAATGHDENITYAEMERRIGAPLAAEIRAATLAIFAFASEFLDARGIVLADTKFEFGMCEGRLTIVDEMLTPDSSRFWVKGAVGPTGEPVSFDKQFVRDYLEALGWDKTPPAPRLPAEVIEQTSKRYLEIYEKITGQALSV